MSQNTQPLTVTMLPADAPLHPEANRLLTLWVDIARRAAATAAHNASEAQELRHLQNQVEEAVLDRFPQLQQLLDELMIWETTLEHDDQAVPPEACLLCRRARLKLPLGLPFPTVLGGAR